MQNGDAASTWSNTMAVTKLEAFLMFAKLRLPNMSAKDIWKSATGTDDLLSVITPKVVVPDHVTAELTEWLAQEVRENVALLHMADGNVITEGEQPIEFKNDVHTYCSGNSLAVSEARFEFALDAMLFVARCPIIAERASVVWKPVLKLAKSINNCFTVRSDELYQLLGLKADEDETVISLKKFRENDDLFVLQHGFDGYMDALDKVLKKIGGREWDMQVLEVLERKAGMITEFRQFRLLVDVLPSVHSMIDMRIQQSLNRIFKSAFNNLKFSVKKEVVNYYYQKYQVWSTADMDPNYSTELNLIINNLSNTTKGKYRLLASRLCWHFMLNAKNCWWRIATAVISTPNLLEPVVELLRVLNPVVSLRLPVEKNSKLNVGKDNNVGNRLVLEGWNRLLEHKMVETEDQENVWSDFVVRLCNGLPKKCVLDATEILHSFLLPMLTERPDLILSCMCKIFRDKTTQITWRSDVTAAATSEVSDSQGVDSIGLFAAIFEIFGRASHAGHPENPLNLEVRTLCPQALSALVERWQYDGVQLLDSAFDWLKSRVDALPWIQQVYCFWLLRESCAGTALLDAPECLFDALCLPADRYRPIDCPPISDNHRKIDCVLGSMIEAACFSTELGLMFLRDGNFAYFSNLPMPQVRDHLLYAIKTVMADRNLTEWKKVIEWLKEFFDEMDKKASCNDSLCAYPDQRLGYKFIAPVAIFGDVAILMLKGNHSKDTLRLWLQNFFSVARDFQAYIVDNLPSTASKETALRRLWSIYSALVKSFDEVSRPKQMDWLFQGLFETWRRCNLQIMQEMLLDVKSHLSSDVVDNMIRVLGSNSDLTNA